MPIPKVVMTQELIDEYARKYPGVNHAHRPYCKLCSTTIDDVHNQPHRVEHDRWKRLPEIHVHYVFIGIGELAYRALFINQQLAYYHIKCLDEHQVLKANVESRLLKIKIPIAVSP
jgi:hypothetical protein